MSSKIINLVKGSIDADNKARLVSDLCNPLIMPPLALTLIGYSITIPADRILLLFVITLLFYSLLPLVSAILLSQKVGSDSLDFNLRSSRRVLYGISVSSAFAGSLLLFLYFEANYLRLTAAIFLINLIAALLVNFLWKVSVHTASVTTAGVCLLIFSRFSPEMFYPTASGLLLLCVILPLVGWSRYRLNVHTIPELIGGLSIGIISTGITALIWHYH